MIMSKEYRKLTRDDLLAAIERVRNDPHPFKPDGPEALHPKEWAYCRARGVLTAEGRIVDHSAYYRAREDFWLGVPLAEEGKT